MRKNTESLSLSAPSLEKQYKLLNKPAKIILRLLLVLFTNLMVFAGYQAFINTSNVPRNRDTTRYQDILTEDEQAAWKSKDVQTGEVVFQLNLEIPVDSATSQAEIRLINPPYSDFICKVSLKEAESSIVLYESEEMIPGTVIQYVTLSEILAVGKYDCVARYSFLDDKGKVYGNYDVEVILKVNEGGSKGSVVNPYEVTAESESR